MSRNGRLSELLPSWKGQLNIARHINKDKNLYIPDDVFDTLEHNRPDVPNKHSVVLVLDIKLDTPKHTIQTLMKCLHHRYDECSVSKGICFNGNGCNLYPMVEWKSGVSWKLVDLRAYTGFSTSDVRNIVNPNCLPSTSLGWILFYSRMTMDGETIPFLKASGFDLKTNGTNHGFSNTIGFKVKDKSFEMCCQKTNASQKNWSNPVLVEA